MRTDRAGRVPSRFFICIGAQKAGTTWLAEQLRRHPEISLPPRKEIRYFDTLHVRGFEDVRAERTRDIGTRISRVTGRKSELTLPEARNLRWLANYGLIAREEYNDQWYWSLFAMIDETKLTGDFSPAYSLLPETGIRHMKECVPHAKLFFVLRNPVERIWSGVAYALRHDIDAKGQLPSAKRIRSAALGKIQGELSNYRRTIESYENVFGKGRLNIQFYDLLCRDPLQFLREFCDLNEIGFDSRWFRKVAKRVNEGPRLPRDMSILRDVANSCRDQLDWLARRFGGYAEIWRAEAESIVSSPQMTGALSTGVSAFQDNSAEPP